MDVVGIDPETARDVARLCQWGPCSAAGIAERVHMTVSEAEAVLLALGESEFLEPVPHRVPDDDETWWVTTVRGGALANASFLKPMTRTKAQSLLDGVLERASAYNGDPSKPVFVDRISVFGSFLNSDAVDFGDLDLHVVLSGRSTSQDPSTVALAYAEASGRSFGTLIDQLAWPEREARQILKNRNGRISIHTEDISRFTDVTRVVYERATGAAGRE